MNLKTLGLLVTEAKYAGSSFPVHARIDEKFSDGSANALTKAVLAYLKLKGVEARRQSTEGRFIQEKSVVNAIGQKIITQKGKYLPRGKQGGVGSADITGTLPPHGKRIEIEIKFGKDTQSEEQKEFQAKIISMGGIYMIAKTWDDFYFQISKYVP